jgi:hypothetical protein
MPQTVRKHAYGGPMHRMVNKPVHGGGARLTLRPGHPALAEARTLFPHSVVDPQDSPRLLVAGWNQRKIGARVTKGRWAGLPIYTLTLEERATCPRSCLEWANCYGNSMNWARRHRHGLPLEVILASEVVDLERRHPAGFVVRLHILGDFYSVAYAELWGIMLEHCPELRVFGFTARGQDTAIGQAVAVLNATHPDRCRIRFSGTDTGRTGSLVIARREDSRHVICPVQLGKSDCCGTCGLCWTMDRTVEFVRH